MYPVAVTTREDLTQSIWRAKIDKDDLRRDLLEMKTVLDFIASQNNGLCTDLPLGIVSIL